MEVKALIPLSRGGSHLGLLNPQDAENSPDLGCRETSLGLTSCPLRPRWERKEGGSLALLSGRSCHWHSVGTL